MGRKTKRVTIAVEGRDKGKTFVLTEAPAMQAESWFYRALLGLIQSGADIPAEALQASAASFAALAASGISALGGIKWETLEPLLAEMVPCIQYAHAPEIPLQPIFDGAGCQIEEIATFIALRAALLELHLGFSVPEVPPTSGTKAGDQPGSIMSTCLESLAGWFRRAFVRS